MSDVPVADNFLSNARAVVRRSAKRVGLNDKEINEFITPHKRHAFKIELDGKNYDAYRIQHNNKLGPFKGGIRFHPEVSQGEVEALSVLMSIKTAAVGLPLGGGKGGVSIDPTHLTSAQLEELSRKYVRNLHPHIGPDKDIPAPDVNTDSSIMDWMVDEFEQLTGDTSKAAFTGKSVSKGGSAGREAATGRGGVIALREVLGLKGHDKKRLTIAVQGFGNVGYWFAKLASQYEEFKVISISDSSHTVTCMAGLDVDAVMQAKQAARSVGDYKGDNVKVEGSDAILTSNVDVLVLAALDNAINQANMEDVQAHYLVELANGPITDAAYRHLHKSGAVILPDVLANAGGVIVSYFEWLQNQKGEKWTEARVNRELEIMMKKAANEVFTYSERNNLNMKDAAFDVALRRIIQG